ncbi:MAG: 4a-hydroxytetrahydrobiopterin dehydratase [Ktedonobacterales bacterium]
MTKLSASELEQAMAQLDGWSVEENALVKTLRFSTFPDGIAFVNRVADLAEDEGHHPDIDIRYSTVILRLSTHDEGGITAKDTALARRINVLSRQ